MKLSKRSALYLIAGLLLLSGIKTQAQPWLKPPYYNNVRPDSTHPVLLKDVQAAFEQWQENHIKPESEETEQAPKGDEEEEQRPGWLQFKRWEHYMTPRVYPSGDISLPSKKYQIFKDYANSLPSSQNHQTDGAHQYASALTGGWTSRGPNSVPSGGGAGRVTFVRFNPLNSNTIWIGAPSGGLWKSTNGGSTWSTNTNSLSVIGCSDIAINPLDTNIMYLATGDGDHSDNNSIGVLKSTDGGNTWNTTGLVWPVSDYYTIYKLLINPYDTSSLILASNGGIFSTTNSGTTWSMVLSGDFTDIAYMPGAPTTIYAVSTSFYISTNSGASFTPSNTGLPAASTVQRLEIGTTPANPSYVYVLAANTTYYGFLGLYLSTNSGASFSTQSTTPNILGYETDGSDVTAGQGWYDLSVCVNPTNASDVYVGGVNHWRSTNAGVSWTCITQWYGCCGYPYVHADVHRITFLPGSATTLFSCNDGGIFKSTNNGAAWTDYSSNLQIAQMYALGLSATDSNLTITGHQDNGTNLMDGSTWSYVIGGDGMDCLIDNVDSNIMYGEIYYGEIYKSTDKGVNFNSITNSSGTGVNAQGEWVTPFVMNPANDNILLVGKYQLFTTSNAGSTWAQLGTLPIDSPDEIIAIAYAPSNPNYIYVATYNQIFVSVNNGSTFTNITGSLPVGSASISNIAVCNTNPAKVWVTFSGYSSGNKVYASSNTGSTWTNYSTGLPNLPANCISYQNNTNDGLYVGMDVGVYFISNSLSSWQPFFTGMPDVVVDDLGIQYQENIIRAATFGRGLWQSGLAIPVPAFSVNQTTACTGTAVNFTDLSVGSPTGWSWTLTGATPSTSTSQNPSVTYSTPGTYAVTLTASNANGTNSITQTSYITVVASSVAGTATASTNNICAGNTTVLTLSGNTGNIQWQSSANDVTFTNISGATSATYNSPSLTATTYYRAVVTSSTCAAANSAVQTVTVNPASVGGTASAANTTLCSGNSTTLTLTGNTGSIQWQSSANGTTFSNVSGATSATYLTPALTSAAYYRAVVTDGVCPSANSTTDSITINPVSVGGTATATSSTICAGNTTAITLTGNTGTVQWQSSADGITFTNLVHGNSSSYPTPALTTTTYYRAVVTSGICVPSNSSTAIVTVNPVSTGGIATPAADTICSGNSAILNLAGSTGNIQWQSSTDNVTFSNISSATSSSYTTPALTTTTYYRAVVTSGACAPANSLSSVVVVNPAPFAGIASAANGTICSGNSTVITLSGSSGNIQWQSSADNITFTNISGATLSSYTTPQLTSTTYYRALVTSGVCAAANSTLAIVTINPVSVAGAATAATDTICSGNSTVINLTGNNGTIQWQSSADNTTFTNISGATSASYTTSSLTATTYYRAVVTNGVCPSSGSASAEVVVSPVPFAGIARAANGTICTGTSTVINLVGSTGNIQWQTSADNVTFTNINAANSSSYTTPLLTSTTYYRAVVTSGVCPSANSTLAIINVVAAPVGGVAFASNGTLCSGNSTTINLNGSSGTIQWQSSPDDITFTNISGATSSHYTTATLNATTYYLALVTTNGVCSSAKSTTATVIVNPASVGGTAAATNTQLCSGSSTTITLTGNTGIIQWQSSTDNSNFSNITGATSAVYATPVLTSTTYYRAVDSSNNCPSATSVVATVTVNPLPLNNISTSGPTTFCQGGNVVLSAAAGLNYNWSNGATLQNLTVSTGGSFTVTLTDANQCSAVSSPVSITVLPATAVITQPFSQQTCIGGNVTFNVSATGVNLSYQWVQNANTVPSAVLSSLNISSAAYSDTGRYAVIVSGTCGTITSDTVQLTVTPTLQLSQQPAAQTVCQGEPVTFTVVANGGSASYQWLLNGSNISGAHAAAYSISQAALADSGSYSCAVTSSCGNVTSNAAYLHINPILASGYSKSICSDSSYNFNGRSLNVTGTYYDTLSTISGCDSIVTLQLQVLQVPQPVIHATGDTTFCAGSSVTLASSTNAIWSYQWQRNGVNISGATGSGRFVNNSGAYNVDVTDTIGCMGISNNILVTANPVVVPAISIAANTSDTICAGTNVIFTNSTVNGGNQPIYLWKVNGTTTGSNANTFSASNLANGNSVTCVLISDATCATPDTVISDSIIMTVNTTTGTSVNISFSPAGTICTGTAVTLAASVSNGGNTPSYLWKKNGANAGITSTYIDTLPANHDIISVQVTGSNTCANPAIAVEADTLSVTTTVTPAVTISAIPSGPVCSGTLVNFTANADNGGTFPAYNWKRDGNVVDSTSTYSNNSLTNGDIITCEVTSNSVCVTSSVATSNSISMVVYPLPATPVITQIGSNLQSSAASGNQWFLNNTVIAGATAQNYTPQQNGIYTLVVTDAQQCSSDTSAGFNYVTGISAVNDFSVRVYPNPTNSKLFVQSGNNAIAGIEVIDMLGQTKIVRQTNQTFYELDVSELAVANYLLVVRSDNGVAKVIFNVER